MARKKPPNTPAEIVRAFDGESDRGSILVGTAWVEAALRDLLETVFLGASLGNPFFARTPHGKLMEELLNGTSASSRAKTCAALGLISAKRHKSLESLFEFRNRHFAHWPGEIDWSDADLRADAERLFAAVGAENLFGRHHFPAAYRDYFKRLADAGVPFRRRFRDAIGVIVMELRAATQHVAINRLPPNSPEVEKWIAHVGRLTSRFSVSVP